MVWILCQVQEDKKEIEECVTIHENIHHNDIHGCNFCGEQFESKRNMMEHKKKVHIEMVALCWNLSAGKCGFGDDFCWFSHRKSSENFNCNICGKVLKTKNETHYHQKHDHEMGVPQCKNASQKRCLLG